MSDATDNRLYRELPTPRTDAEQRWVEWNGNEFLAVQVEFARELERELARCMAAHAKLVRLAGGVPPPGHSEGRLEHTTSAERVSQDAANPWKPVAP